MANITGEVTLSEELERKTIDALASIAEQSERGCIDQYTALVATKAIFEVTSGLLPQSTFEYVGNLLNYFTYEPSNKFLPIIRFCQGKSGAFVMFVNLFKNKLILFHYDQNNNSFVGKSKDFESKQELVQYASEMWDAKKELVK